MVELATNQVNVAIESHYLCNRGGQFMFEYSISIVNENSFSLQLISREWTIISCDGVTRQVSGDGVVGLQPVIRPGESFQYTSFTVFASEVGTMKGAYTMKRENDDGSLTVTIPAFTMVAPYKLN